MSILVDRETRVLVQGITGREGSFHAERMIDYGTRVVAGVVPGRGGEEVVGVAVFDTVREAVEAEAPDATVLYVPARFAPDAIYEAAEAGIGLIICITEGIPALELLRIRAYLDEVGVRMVGPNCPGIISPGEAKLGIMPGEIHAPGSVGLVSRSGTLTYEVVKSLTAVGIGQSTVIGIGGDAIIGTDFIEVLAMFQEDPATDSVVLIGEIGGSAEERAANYIAEHVTKPVVGFVAGRTAPPGKRMGHAGAIISGGKGTAAEKVRALEETGVPVARHPAQVAELVSAL
ncbi:MAG: succinate--CoA ligase subunit alpha [Anaerolineae bacterium]